MDRTALRQHDPQRRQSHVRGERSARRALAAPTFAARSTSWTFAGITGIRKFHHVSTAYVCGLREGRVLESDLDVGQPLGNDYEKSKVQAEKLVQAADFLDQRTVYRPSIIVGDSHTGYTATFHGFYATLKLAHTLVSKVVLGATGGQPLMAALGLRGKERKNFVPVDWVSAVMTHILGQPQHHGKTYHLTTPKPMPIAEMTAVVQAAVETFSTLADESDQLRCDGSWFADTFRQQMDIYRAYCATIRNSTPPTPGPRCRNCLARRSTTTC